LQKLKGFFSSTKLFAIRIIAMARMAIVNNHAIGLHNLQDLNDKIMDLVRSFFLCSFIYVVCYTEIVNDLETLLQALHPCLPLLELFTFTSYSIVMESTLSGANCVSSLMYIQEASITSEMYCYIFLNTHLNHS
jgi:hypothetical protein